MMLLTASFQADSTFWEKILFFLQKYGATFLSGAGWTLWLALSGTIVGCVIGLAVGIIQTIPAAPGDGAGRRVLTGLLKVVTNIYVEIFRSTPMIVQSMVVYYGSMALFNLNMTPLFAGFLVVSINTGAYMAETVRGGIDSIDPGQTEGAKSIGMNHVQTMYHVILPQTIRNILPQIGNNLVINIKDTSVLNVISVTELYFVAKSIASTYYQFFVVFSIACAIYFVLCFVTTRLLRLLEKKLDGPENYRIAGTESARRIGTERE